MANFRDKESLITEVTVGNGELMPLSMEYCKPDAAQCISVPFR